MIDIAERRLRRSGGALRLVVVSVGADGLSEVGSDGPADKVTLIAAGGDPMRAQRRALNEVPTSLQPGETAVVELMIASGAGPGGYYRASPDRYTALDLPPGRVRWNMAHFAPAVETSMHQTATIDHDFIVSGAVELILDRTTVHLASGDAVIIPAARHAWRTTSLGCVIAVLMVGTMDPSSEPA